MTAKLTLGASHLGVIREEPGESGIESQKIENDVFHLSDDQTARDTQGERFEQSNPAKPDSFRETVFPE